MSSNPSAVTIEGLRKEYASGGSRDDAEVAVRKLDLTINHGEFFSIVGPSGCGKTTTLRCIAGLESINAGRILIHDQVVNDSEAGIFVPPERRKIALVFQSYAIWPHLTVFENVAFPLRVGERKSRMRKADIKERVLDALQRVELETYANRRPADLSGGQQQRVALARAVVTDPQLLLLDEPLSNLDARLKERMKFELRELQMRLGVTTINVTHDQAEALAVSDRIAVLDHGRLVQLGVPSELYFEPKSRFVARFISRANTASGVVEGVDEDGCATVMVGTKSDGSSVTLTARRPKQGSPAKQGEMVCVAIRPESFRLDLSNSETAGTGPGASGSGAETATGSIDTNVLAAEIAVVGLSDGGVLEARVKLTDLSDTEWIIRWPSTTGKRPDPGTSIVLRAAIDDCLLVLDSIDQSDDEADAIEADAEHGMNGHGVMPPSGDMTAVSSDPAGRV
jgi:iron(III) transport system ATP-binding protein